MPPGDEQDGAAVTMAVAPASVAPLDLADLTGRVRDTGGAARQRGRRIGVRRPDQRRRRRLGRHLADAPATELVATAVGTQISAELPLELKPAPTTAWRPPDRVDGKRRVADRDPLTSISATRTVSSARDGCRCRLIQVRPSRRKVSMHPFPGTDR
jgi:hypothetical protein